MPHVTGKPKEGHEDKWGTISAIRKKAIRKEMLTRWKKKLRKKGAAKAAGGDPTKTSGTDPKTGKKYGTGSLFGWKTDAGVKMTQLERDYAKTVRKTQRKKASDPVTGADYVIPGTKKTKKVIAKTTRATGAGSPKLVTAMSMKSKKQGGTVSFGSHKGADKKKAAGAWRRKHLAAAGDDAAKIKKIKDRYKHMRGIKPK